MPRVKKHLHQKCLWFFWAACFGLTAMVAMPFAMHTTRSGLYAHTYTHNLATPDEEDVGDLSRLETGENQTEGTLHGVQGDEADVAVALPPEGLRTDEDLAAGDEAMPDGSRKNRRQRAAPKGAA
jgi:hypothetical protein